MTRKRREYEDYEEIGALLYLAREALLAALVGSPGNKFYAKQQDGLNKVIGRLDDQRLQIDGQYSRDGLRGESPVYLDNDSADYAVVVERAIKLLREKRQV